MKVVILVEGDHDIQFLRHIISKDGNISPDKVKYFPNRGSVENTRNPETNAIRSFLTPWSPHVILAKNEEGKEKVLAYTQTLWNQLDTKTTSARLISLIDYDGKDPNYYFNKIKKNIENRHSGSVVSIEYESTIRKFILKRNIIIRKNSSMMFEVCFIAFFSSLEKIVEKEFPEKNMEDGIKKLAQTFCLNDFIACD